MNVNVKKIKLLHGKILVERAKAEERTSAGIYIPQQHQKQELGIGTIIQCPKNVDDSEIKVGATVYFNKYAGTDISEDYVVLDPKDLLAVI